MVWFATGLHHLRNTDGALPTMKMTTRLLPLLLLSSAAFAQAPLAPAALDCAASADAEPAGWAARCAAPAGDPMPGPWRASPLALGDLAFAYNMSDDWGPGMGLYDFLLDDFPGVSLIGNPGPNIYALDFDASGTILYAIPNDLRELGTIDLDSGQFASIATVSGVATGNFTGLTIHPVTGAAYVSAAGSNDSILYSIDLDTGVAEAIGDMGVPLMIEIAMNCAGELYGHSVFTNSLYRIEPATGTATLVGLYGIQTNFAQGMDFDNSSGLLYASLYTGGGNNQFGTFDLDTGAFNPLVSNDPTGEWELAIPTSCENIFANGFEHLW